MSTISALIVEDDGDLRASVRILVEREGYAVHEAPTLERARELIMEFAPDVVLLDQVLPDGNGMELLSDECTSEMAEFVIMTGNADVSSAVEALREGALDYLTKPVDRSRLRTILTNVARTRGLKQEVSSLRDELRGLGRFGALVGRSKPMQQVYDLISRVAPTDSTVFVTGESGTGKELVAQTVHSLSKRKDHPILAVNCGAMSSTLVESEFFGHEKGSFTGADRRRRGYFEEASEGTLFLDEITEMPIDLQVKLLRVLETNTITRVGSTTPIAIDVRVIAASNRDPLKAVQEGTLREDLLYRLNVFPIHVPPLHERGEDILLLAQLFLDEVNQRDGTTKRLGDAAERHLMSLGWPGNVRQLKNVIERAAILADSVIGTAELPASGIGSSAGREDNAERSMLHVRVGSAISDVERRLILATIEELDGDKKRAAELLGISLKTLYNRLNVYDAAQNGRI